VIDGGSSDGTVDVIRKHEQALTHWVSEPDTGIYCAMNKGLRIATGAVVGYLNADDMFCRPDALSQLIAPFEDPNVDAVFANVAMVDRNDVMRIRRYYATPRFSPWNLRFGYMPPHATFFVRREKLLEAGGFSERYRIAGDFDLMLRLFCTNRLSYRHVPATLVTFRMGGLSKQLLTGNREFYRACRENGIWTQPLLLASRYFVKVTQFFLRPKRLEEMQRKRWLESLRQLSISDVKPKSPSR
jgi:glycosyltransferase involved in cell wall biosynthesis